MDFFHNKLRKKFSWYSIWHNHPRHSHAHWLIFVFTLLFIGSLLSVQVIGLYPENINRASAQTGTIQVAPILSSWSPPQTANGWWAKLSPDGRYVTYGNWGENWVTDLQTGQSWDFSNPAQLVPGGRCIAGYWTLPDTLTFVCEAGQDAAGYMFQRYEVKVGTWVPVLTSDDLHLVAGGFFAKDGHWATYWPFRLVKDNKTLIGSVGGSANPNDTGGIGGLTGSLMATACDNTNTSFCIWDGDTLAYSYPTQFGFYDLRIGEGSYVAYGDRYNLQGVCLSDWQEINLKAGDPAAAEGIHAIFGVNGKPWLASATWNAGPMYLLLRPWGERKSIVVQVDSVHSSIVHNNGIFTIAYRDDVGRMKVITVADTAPRNDLTGGLKDETCGATATILPPEYYEPTSFNPSNQPFGATQTLPNPPAAMPLGDFIGYIFLYSLYMVGLTVFVMITWAGVLWLTSRGNPSQIALAKHKIYNAIIGAIILVSGFAILYSINPALVQGTIRFPGLKPSATSVQSTSVIIQATCSGGVCSDDNSACTVDTDCNNVCIDNACNNGAPGTCTYDTDCQLLNRAWGTSDVEIASALSSGCFMISGTQEFSSVQCPLGSSILAPDPLVQIQDASANQQVGAITIHSAGNTGLGKRVVVLDTGYNYNHPELQSSYLGGRDFVNNDNDPMDDNGHGSHVAGIITGDGIDPRSRGVAPDAGIIAGKVLASNGGGFGSDIVKGIYWAIDGPDGIYGTSDDFKPDIINISIGSKTKVVRSLCDNSEQIFANAVRYANDHGALVVASSGNEGDGGVTLPGCIDNAITVGAVDGSNNSAYFSGKGMAVDVVAPGVNIYSAGTGNSYTTLSGTSQAAPIVSGIAALIKFANPALAVSELKRILISTVQDLGAAGWDDIFGWGLEMASPNTTPPPCSGGCATVQSSFPSCTKGSSTNFPANCDIVINYSANNLSSGSLVIKKNGNIWRTRSCSGTCNGSEPDSDPAVGMYNYSIHNGSGGPTLANVRVYISATGSINSVWASCVKNSLSNNLDCNIDLSYFSNGITTGSLLIKRNGQNWRLVPAPSGTATDNTPAPGLYTYSIHDPSGSLIFSRTVVRIEDSLTQVRSPLVVTGIFPNHGVTGQVVKITGTNLSSTVQVFNSRRYRFTTVGTINSAGTEVMYTIDPALSPGPHTLRVGPNLFDFSNEFPFTVDSAPAATPSSTPTPAAGGASAAPTPTHVHPLLDL